MTTATIKNTHKRRRHDVVFPIVNTIVLCLIMIVTLYPVLNTVAYSFNDGMDAVKGGIGIWPRVWSTDSYVSLIKDPAIYKAFGISVSKTVLPAFRKVGIILSVLGILLIAAAIAAVLGLFDFLLDRLIMAIFS